MSNSNLYQVQAHAPDGTCIYLRCNNGIEIVNVTEYTGDEALQRAQRMALEHFAIPAEGPLFVYNAPAGIDSQALALLAFATHYWGVVVESQVLQNQSKVVDSAFA